MPELPNQRYIRRGAIKKCYGFTDDEFTKLVRAGVLTPHYLQGKGRAFFRRDEVIAAEDANKIFKPSKESKQ